VRNDVTITATPLPCLSVLRARAIRTPAAAVWPIRPKSSPSHGFVPADSIFPRIGVTRQTIKKLETIHMVRRESPTAIPRWVLKRRHYPGPRFRPGLIQISTPGAPDS